MLNLDDRETVAQITENMYLQYFLGYSSYIKRPPFNASLLWLSENGSAMN
nr:transposase [Algoriphagus antarcticus]